MQVVLANSLSNIKITIYKYYKRKEYILIMEANLKIYPNDGYESELQCYNDGFQQSSFWKVYLCSYELSMHKGP